MSSEHICEDGCTKVLWLKTQQKPFPNQNPMVRKGTQSSRICWSPTLDLQRIKSQSFWSPPPLTTMFYSCIYLQLYVPFSHLQYVYKSLYSSACRQCEITAFITPETCNALGFLPNLNKTKPIPVIYSYWPVAHPGFHQPCPSEPFSISTLTSSPST